MGSIAPQLARRLTGLMVIATASRAETQAWCRKMGEQGRLLNEVSQKVDAKDIRTTMRQSLGLINAGKSKMGRHG